MIDARPRARARGPGTWDDDTLRVYATSNVHCQIAYTTRAIRHHAQNTTKHRSHAHGRTTSRIRDDTPDRRPRRRPRHCAPPHHHPTQSMAPSKTKKTTGAAAAAPVVAHDDDDLIQVRAAIRGRCADDARMMMMMMMTPMRCAASRRSRG